MLQRGVERVAIWDFDAHHGNGTEDIVAHHSNIAFASIHQSPGYPGTGLTSFANIDNFPLLPYTRRTQHIDTVGTRAAKLVAFQPDLLLVSAGFDAFRDDPITEMTLEHEDFATFGKWVNQTGIAAAAVLEGGYSDELPELVDAFLTGWTNGHEPKETKNRRRRHLRDVRGNGPGLIDPEQGDEGIFPRCPPNKRYWDETSASLPVERALRARW